MDQVLFNLLFNAFKFTGDNGSILVSIEKNNETNQAILQVEDTGIGMTEEAELSMPLNFFIKVITKITKDQD